MTTRVHLSRWVCGEVEDNLRRLGGECRRAVAGGCQLVVFPELFLTGYRRQLEPARAREAFSGLSGEAPEVLFVFGAIAEEGRDRVTAWLGGREVSRYDKVHLFHPNREHELFSPGDRYVALRWRGLSIGLMNCNDVRFPEQARALRLEAGCDMLILPAWWPWRRDHAWRSLLRARAIENGVWVLGCSIVASVHPEEDFAGAGNHVFDPAGEPVRTADDRTYELDLDHPPDLVVDTAEQAVDIGRVEITDTAPAPRGSGRP